MKTYYQDIVEGLTCPDSMEIIEGVFKEQKATFPSSSSSSSSPSLDHRGFTRMFEVFRGHFFTFFQSMILDGLASLESFWFDHLHVTAYSIQGWFVSISLHVTVYF